MPITETVEYYVYAQNYQESEMESVLKRQNKQLEKNPTNTHKTKQTQKTTTTTTTTSAAVTTTTAIGYIQFEFPMVIRS